MNLLQAAAAVAMASITSLAALNTLGEVAQMLVQTTQLQAAQDLADQAAECLTAGQTVGCATSVVPAGRQQHVGIQESAGTIHITARAGDISYELWLPAASQ